jgi:hypothetical protein
MHSGELANTSFIVFVFTRPGLEHTQGEHTNHFTTKAILFVVNSYVNVAVWTPLKMNIILL